MDNDHIFAEDVLSDDEIELLDSLESSDSDDSTSTDSDKTPKSWRQVEITQDCRFGWTSDNVAKFLDGWKPVLKYAYITHDKDFKPDNVTPREHHTHLMLKFNNPVRTEHIIARAKSVGLPDDCITFNRLEKIKNWKAALNYLTHRDVHVPYKHVYDVSDVHSDFDWEAECEMLHFDKDLSTSNRREKEIVEGIFNGTITEYNLENYMTHYEMVTYDAAITKAIKRINEINSSMEERSMEVIFVSGKSGYGKDTFAVEWCKRNNLAYYRTNNNPEQPFDNYRGQPVIIWSDARDDVFRPHNLHQLLDNHYGSFQKSRYHDKFIAAKYMFITSIKPLEDWYSRFYSNDKEDKTQLYRRIKTKVVMTEDQVYIYTYDGAAHTYKYNGKVPNTYRHEDAVLDTLEKQINHTLEIFGCFKDELILTDGSDNPPVDKSSQLSSINPVDQQQKFWDSILNK